MKIIKEIYLRKKHYETYNGKIIELLPESYLIYHYMWVEDYIEYRLNKEYLFLILPDTILSYRLYLINDHLRIEE